MTYASWKLCEKSARLKGGLECPELIFGICISNLTVHLPGIHAYVGAVLDCFNFIILFSWFLSNSIFRLIYEEVDKGILRWNPGWCLWQIENHCLDGGILLKSARSFPKTLKNHI